MTLIILVLDHAYSRKGLAILAGQCVRKRQFLTSANAVATSLRNKVFFPTPSLDKRHGRELV
jgi:hypothetical protein